MHVGRICFPPWDAWMVGWQSWSIAFPSHFRCSRLGLPGVWDIVARGLLASSLLASCSGGQSAAEVSSPWHCQSCWEPWGCRCNPCIVTSSSQGFSLRSSTAKRPAHCQHLECCQTDHRSQAKNSLGVRGRVPARRCVCIPVAIRPVCWRWLPCWGVIVTTTTGELERHLGQK